MSQVWLVVCLAGEHRDHFIQFFSHEGEDLFQVESVCKPSQRCTRSTPPNQRSAAVELQSGRIGTNQHRALLAAESDPHRCGATARPCERTVRPPHSVPL